MKLFRSWRSILSPSSNPTLTVPNAWPITSPSEKSFLAKRPRPYTWNKIHHNTLLVKLIKQIKAIYPLGRCLTFAHQHGKNLHMWLAQIRPSLPFLKQYEFINDYTVKFSIHSKTLTQFLADIKCDTIFGSFFQCLVHNCRYPTIPTIFYHLPTTLQVDGFILPNNMWSIVDYKWKYGNKRHTSMI